MKLETRINSMLNDFQPRHIYGQGWWSACKILDDMLELRPQVAKKMPKSNYKWMAKFWLLFDEFLRLLENQPEARSKPKVILLLKEVWEINQEKTLALMQKRPAAWSEIDEEWALWTRMIA